MIGKSIFRDFDPDEESIQRGGGDDAVGWCVLAEAHGAACDRAASYALRELAGVGAEVVLDAVLMPSTSE